MMQNITQRENGLKGTLDWQLTRFRFDYPEHLQASPLIRGLRTSAIEGFASRTSVYPGETIDFYVSVEAESPFTIDIYRLGYYGGTGGRLMQHIGPIHGTVQPLPMETIERLRECDWASSYSLAIPKTWVSGVYLAKLTRDELHGVQSYIIFVVKEQRETDILVQVSDLTWQAYNKWPASSSLYDDGSPALWYIGPNVRVSFDRPYAKYCQVVDAPLSCGSGGFLLWEFPLAFWLESEGYNVTYCSNLDLHADPSLLEHCKVFISVGHDEYWTRDMYQNASAARDSGVNLLFFSGNSVSGEIIPYANSRNGEPFRSFARKTLFTDEAELMGERSYGPGYGDWTVIKPEHWIFEGTGMKYGDSIPGLIGWEYHGAPYKEIEGFEVLAQSELFGGGATGTLRGDDDFQEGDGKHSAVIYRGPLNNWIFNAGTIWWVQGLSNPPGHIPAVGTYGRVQGPDPRVQQITRNLLNRCLSGNQ